MRLSSVILIISMQLFGFVNVSGQTNQFKVESAVDSSSYESKKIFTFLHSPLEDSLLLVQKRGKYGIMDSIGVLVVPLIYDEIIFRSSTEWTIRELYLYELRNANMDFYGYWENGGESEEEYAHLLKQELSDTKSFLNLSRKYRADPVFTARKGNKWG